MLARYNGKLLLLDFRITYVIRFSFERLFDDSSTASLFKLIKSTKIFEN